MRTDDGESFLVAGADLGLIGAVTPRELDRLRGNGLQRFCYSVLIHCLA